MVAFDAEVLRSKPAIFAPGGAEAAGAPNPDAPACQAALSAFRTALMFRVIFTGFVAVLGLLTLVALAYVIYKILNNWDATATLASLGGAVTGIAAGWLVSRMNQSINVQRNALEDVSTYCGTQVKEQLQ